MLFHEVEKSRVHNRVRIRGQGAGSRGRGVTDFEGVGFSVLELLVVGEKGLDRFIVVRQVIGIIANCGSMFWVEWKTFVKRGTGIKW